MKSDMSDIYGLRVVPKNIINFLLNNSLLPLLPGVRLLLSKRIIRFLGTTLEASLYSPDFISENIHIGGVQIAQNSVHMVFTCP